LGEVGFRTLIAGGSLKEETRLGHKNIKSWHVICGILGMKIIFALICCVIFGVTSYSQCIGGNYDLNFDTSLGFCHLTIDTLTDSTNIWQVGKPQKTVFDSAYSPKNVIVTDSLNPYAINDTSYFIITNTTGFGGFTVPSVVLLSGYYYVNTDTLTDYGKIEFSADHGATWIDLINDTTYASYIHWSLGKPTLTGNSNGWKRFYVHLGQLGPVLGISDGDTVLYKFSFFSDSVQTYKDGLMFDDFRFEDWAESVPDINTDNLISLYPVPARDELYVNTRSLGKTRKLKILNTLGALVYQDDNFLNQTVDIHTLKTGMYVLYYSDEEHSSVKRFTVVR
jgi:hypothetical protein